MVRILFFLCFLCLLTSCFVTNCRNANSLFLDGYIDGKHVEKYKLVYLVNNDTVKNTYEHNADIYIYEEELQQKLSYERSIDESKIFIRCYNKNYNNTFFSYGGDLTPCGAPLRGKVNIVIYLKNIKTGNFIRIGEKFVDMDEFPATLIQTQVFIGPKKDYRSRRVYNIIWDKTTPLYQTDISDTIYYYTVKYMASDNEPFLKGDYDESMFSEVP